MPNYYRPHPKDGEGNVFSLSTLGGGGQVIVQPGGGQVRVQPGGGGQVRVQPGGGQVSRGWGGGSVQPAGGVSILRPLTGGMPLAFTQEDFLVSVFSVEHTYLSPDVFYVISVTRVLCDIREYMAT